MCGIRVAFIGGRCLFGIIYPFPRTVMSLANSKICWYMTLTNKYQYSRGKKQKVMNKAFLIGTSLYNNVWVGLINTSTPIDAKTSPQLRMKLIQTPSTHSVSWYGNRVAYVSSIRHTNHIIFSCNWDMLCGTFIKRLSFDMFNTVQ